MGQINTNNYPTVNSLADADLLIVENAQNGTGTTTPKQLRENAIGTDPLQTASQSVTGAINELKNEIDAGAGVVRYDVDAITDGYLGQFSGSADLLLLHLTTDGTADANNGYMMMLSYSRPVARFAYGRLVDTGGAAYKHDVYADNTIICIISNNGTGTESDPKQVVILGIMNAGFTLTPAAVVSDRDIIDGQGNTLSVLAEALTKTASGNPVVISDCAGGKARSLKTAINAIQDLHGLPFPYVGGAYKNKFDITEISDVANSYKTKEFTLKANVTYTISTDLPKNNNNSANLFFYLPSASPDTSVNGVWSEQTRTLTTGADGKFIIGYRTTDYTDPSAEWYLSHKIQIEEGSTATSYAPYSNICPISGRTEARVDDVGLNYYNTADLRKDGDVTYTVNNGTLTITSRAVRPKVYFAPPDKFGGKNVTFSFKIDSITNGGGAVFFGLVIRNKATSTYRYASASNCTTTGNKSASAVLAAEETIERIDFNVNDSSSALSSDRTYVLSNIQFEIGSTATAYVPYVTPTNATIQLGTTVYGADINWDTGVATVTHVSTTITGDNVSNISPQSAVDTEGGKRININITNAKYCGSATGLSDIISDRLSVASANDIYSETTPNRISVNDVGGIVLRYAGAATIEAAEAALNANPVQACYELATPTTLQLTPAQLQMLKGYNRVTIDNGSIELGYIAKIA